ncbi:MAG TPA: MupA/Atu3671 family FMN-dependent luciferase-like monooxygenase, partial [Polyangiales bacterium]|nr:MupA/Atu3671 family FMN-dependent luciferase-like monooxygenase [Polyangiales bacterium]
DALELATAEGTLVVQQLSDMYGRPLPPLAAAEVLELEPGMQLRGLSQAQRDWLRDNASRLARSEAFWLERLSRVEPATLALASSARPAAAPIELDVAFESAPLAVAVLCAYLARTSGKHSFDLGYSAGPAPAELDALFFEQLPLRVEVDDTASFQTLMAAVTHALDDAASRGPCLRDVYARHAALRVRPELASGALADVAVLCSGERPPPGAALGLVLAETPRLLCDPNRLPEAARGLLCGQLLQLAAAARAEPALPLAALSIVPAAERAQLEAWNDTSRPLPEPHATVHAAIEAQCARTPDRTALIFEERRLSYAQLNVLAERLAARLRAEGVGPDTLVGVFVERGLGLPIAALGIWKAGGAYLPLDPSYPAERLRFMREDSGIRIVVSEATLAERWPSGVQVIDVVQPTAALVPPPSQSSDLAYVIYTSGSTGQPKGVMVEHRQVLNFFAGMDEVVPRDERDPVWLSVTSLSFDISVLELFWTLSRGFGVVIYRDRARESNEPISRVMPAVRPRSRRPLDFSLFLWGAQDTRSDHTYRLMLEAARFGDQHGFAAIWTPERHFHAFGGPYPNPSVTGAALAAITERIQIRAGSCVVPLHHPIRVAEEWAFVDNISQGRVGISFASGWQPDDFALRPESYRENKRLMLEAIDQVRRLWRGEALQFPGPLGTPVELRTQPRPIQAELPFWLTSAGHPDTFAAAGRLGANLLTHLLGQSLDELSEKIAIYRRARADAGLDPDGGVVTLMLHTFVGESVAAVRERVREPMKQYLKSSVHLIKGFAWAFPAFKRPAGQADQPDAIDIASLSAEELDAVLEFAFERYFETSGLFGTPESCQAMLDRLRGIGVDDVACLIDFGVPTDEVLNGLVYLDALRERASRPAPEVLSLADQIARYHVTHLQCTPSLLRMARSDDAGRDAIDRVPHLFLGGEAFPADLARELASHSGTVTNMYGPTETTVWSATHRLSAAADSVPLGRPIANTELHVLDAQQRPLPIGVPGELYIAGAGVVRGYHDRPELTAERFLDADGGRMYRTGDLVRWSA